MSLTATAKAQAVDELDEIARLLKRSYDAHKLALQQIRQLQARLVGIDVKAPIAEIRQAHAALASITQPRGGHSANSSQEEPSEHARAAGG